MTIRSGYRGVQWHGRRLIWQVNVQYSGRQYHFGYFRDPAWAARLYDVVALELWGGDAVLNFDGTPPSGMTVEDVRGLMARKGL